MLRLHARTRITLGLVLLLVSVLLLAFPIGLVPDRRGAVMRRRGTLCETLAIAGSARIQKSEFAQRDAVLAEVERRNHDIVSIGVRQEDGDPRTEIGPTRLAALSATPCLPREHLTDYGSRRKKLFHCLLAPVGGG